MSWYILDSRNVWLSCWWFATNTIFYQHYQRYQTSLDLFVTKRNIKTLDNPVFGNNDIVFFDKDSDNVTFSSDEMGILSVDLNNINLDDVNFDEDDPETFIHVLLGVTYLNNVKHYR